MPLRRAGTPLSPSRGNRGPGSAAHCFAKSYALRCVRGTFLWTPIRMSGESALVVLVPEAEAVVKPFRDRYDPSAAAGMPAHITALFPFRAPDDIDDLTLGKLHDCFARLQPIQFSLRTIKR